MSDLSDAPFVGGGPASSKSPPAQVTVLMRLDIGSVRGGPFVLLLRRLESS